MCSQEGRIVPALCKTGRQVESGASTREGESANDRYNRELLKGLSQRLYFGSFRSLYA